MSTLNNLLATACRSLQEQAARMPDEVSREAFRQNVPSHRELLREFVETDLVE